MRRARPRLAALCLLALLTAACASTPPRCQTFDQCAAVVTVAITETRTLATDLLARRAISPATAQRVQDLADEARATVEHARGVARDGNQPGATAALEAAQAVLLRAEAALKERRR